MNVDKDDIIIYIISIASIISGQIGTDDRTVWIGIIIEVFYIIAIFTVWRKERIIYDENRRKKK